MMLKMWSCIFTPRLYRIYDKPREPVYQARFIERWSDNIITAASYMFSLGLYTSPLISMVAYRRGYTMAEVKSWAVYATGFGVFLMLTFVMRGIGRSFNPKYIEFLNTFQNNKLEMEAYMRGISKYDFEFKYWPINYRMSNTRVVPEPTVESTSLYESSSNIANSDLPFYQHLLVRALAWIAVKSFALRLIYPGSLSIIQKLLMQPLLEGRSELVTKHNGRRAKLRTVDGNDIDSMFIDKRGNSPQGKILVVCSEGNSGFYEIGLMGTPIKAGYSALGWNHPGFAGSTGIPYPQQEQNAIDVVMHYAFDLGFKPENIILFGWSIGGYASAWAAVQYPNIKGLVLDATFDDLLPLAENQMPRSWSRLVVEVVRSYVDLNIAQLLKKYEGPVKLVRRTEDEIISLIPGNVASNRANDLMLKLLESRYHPSEEHKKLLKKYIIVRSTQKMNIINEAESAATKLPRDLKDFLEKIDDTMYDYDSTHCTPLPANLFHSIVESIPKR